jgi:hypothetical protein
MWVYPTVPDKMVMVIAIIIGVMFNAVVVSTVMVAFEITFCIWLMLESKALNKEVRAWLKTNKKTSNNTCCYYCWFYIIN